MIFVILRERYSLLIIRTVKALKEMLKSRRDNINDVMLLHKCLLLLSARSSRPDNSVRFHVSR